MDPTLHPIERSIVMAHPRRYVTWCARAKRYPQMEGAAALFGEVKASRQAPLIGSNTAVTNVRLLLLFQVKRFRKLIGDVGHVVCTYEVKRV